RLTAGVIDRLAPARVGFLGRRHQRFLPYGVRGESRVRTAPPAGKRQESTPTPHSARAGYSPAAGTSSSSVRKRVAISIAASIASRPLLPTVPPDRACAC